MSPAVHSASVVWPVVSMRMSRAMAVRPFGRGGLGGWYACTGSRCARFSRPSARPEPARAASATLGRSRAQGSRAPARRRYGATAREHCPAHLAGRARVSPPGAASRDSTSDAELLAQQAVDLGAVRTPLGLAHDRADEGADRLRVAPAHALGDLGVGVDDAGHDGGELVGVPHRAEPLALDQLLRVPA